MKYVISNEQDMKDLVAELLSKIGDRAITLGHATVLALNGDLGAGKTTFTKELAKGLGIQEHVTSPTFVLQKSYVIIDNNKFKKLIHIDAYRLDNSNDVDAIGLREVMLSPQNIVVIEWAKNINEVLPKDAIHIDFEHVDDMTRKVTIDGIL